MEKEKVFKYSFKLVFSYPLFFSGTTTRNKIFFLSNRKNPKLYNYGRNRKIYQIVFKPNKSFLNQLYI